MQGRGWCVAHCEGSSEAVARQVDSVLEQQQRDAPGGDDAVFLHCDGEVLWDNTGVALLDASVACLSSKQHRRRVAAHGAPWLRFVGDDFLLARPVLLDGDCNILEFECV
jgi:hypothetical protein